MSAITTNAPVFNKYEFLADTIGLAQTLPGRAAKCRETEDGMTIGLTQLEEQLRSARKERPDGDVLEKINSLTRNIAEYEARLELLHQYIESAETNEEDMLEIDSPERDEYIAVLTSRLTTAMLTGNVNASIVNDIAMFSKERAQSIWSDASDNFDGFSLHVYNVADTRQRGRCGCYSK